MVYGNISHNSHNSHYLPYPHMSSIRIYPPEDFLEARVTLPLSKSMSARAIIISALTPGAPLPSPVAECDDTAALLDALACPDATEVNVGAAGTTMRFLTAYYASRPGRTVTLDGSERMRRRPIGPLVDALRSAGAQIEYAGEDGFPPLRIKGTRLHGGDISIDASVSSQFVSALLMVAPTMTEGLRLTLNGNVTSRPYIRMTLDMMEEWGVEGYLTDNVVTVPAGTYSIPAAPRPIEGDWSGAAPWYEIESLAAGIITVDNLAVTGSVQGDRVLADIYSHIGVITEPEGEEGLPELTASPDPDARFSYDFTDCPDLAQCVTVTCVMLGIPFRFSGLHTLAVKETDRVEALRTELAKTGVSLDVPAPGMLEWDGNRRPVMDMPVFDTHGDHRMALCLAPIAVYIPGIVINNPEVVSKSYPGFWDQLAAAGFTIETVEIAE